MEVEQAIWPKLNLSLDTLRSVGILQVSRWNIAGIEAEVPEGSLRLRKDDNDDWRIDSEDRVVDRFSVEEFLDTLENLQAEGFIDRPGADLSKYGFDTPRVRLVLGTRNDPETEDPAPVPPFEILVGGEKDGSFFVRAGDWPSIFQVPAEPIRLLEERLSTIREPGLEPEVSSPAANAVPDE
jgi:hypothetical protein